MRFLHTESYRLYEQVELPYSGNPLPQYAILSHTWLPEHSKGVQEVTYQDMKSSYAKLRCGSLKPEGWTLQELIAPTSLMFVDKNWREIIDKINGLGYIERATGIQPEKLQRFDRCSIWERLSWASRRQTTLIEDRAYSLFGLFGINMPLIYGEGERAFLRLQRELIRKYDDGSFLLWEAKPYNEENVIPQRLGALAPSLSCFQPKPDNQRMSQPLQGCNLSISARGLHLDVDLMLLKTDKIGNSDGEWRRYSLFLAFIGDVKFSQYGIYLIKMDSFWGSGYSFERVGHLSTFSDTHTRRDGKIGFTSLGRKSIVIKEGFDIPFQTSLLRLNSSPGFEILATCRGEVGYRYPMDNAEPTSEVFLVRIPYADSQFICHVSGRKKGEYFIISGAEGLHHGFDIIRDSQWRVQMQYEASQTFEVLLGTCQYNPDALLAAPGQFPTRQLRLKGLPSTVHVKIRSRAAMAGCSVQILYLDSVLDRKEPGFHMKSKLLGEAFSIGSTSPREYDVILEHAA